MYYYKIKIVKTSGMLNESANKAPRTLYVEAREPLTERQALIRASKKYKNTYGPEIILADVEQISEGVWDRMKAGAAGLTNKVKTGVKNLGIGAKNAATAAGNLGRAGKALTNYAMTGDKSHINNFKPNEMQAKEQADPQSAKLASLLQSKVVKINKLIKDFDTDVQKMGIQLPPQLKKRWSNAKSMLGTTFVNDIKKFLAPGPNADEQAGADATNAAIADSGE